jgi:hypothetical protein
MRIREPSGRVKQALPHLEKPLVDLDRFRICAVANYGFEEQFVTYMFPQTTVGLELGFAEKSD